MDKIKLCNCEGDEKLSFDEQASHNRQRPYQNRKCQSDHQHAKIHNCGPKSDWGKHCLDLFRDTNNKSQTEDGYDVSDTIDNGKSSGIGRQQE